MVDAFEKLIKDGKKNIEDFIQWLKNCEIIDELNLGEEYARRQLTIVKREGCFEDFVNVLCLFTEKRNECIDEVCNALLEKAAAMEEAFDKLKKDSKNDVDNLTKWMKDSKIIDGLKVTEEKARKMFEDAADQKNIDLQKFKEVIHKVAEEHMKSVADISATLANEAQRFANAVQAGASAFKEAASKK